MTGVWGWTGEVAKGRGDDASEVNDGIMGFDWCDSVAMGVGGPICEWPGIPQRLGPTATRGVSRQSAECRIETGLSRLIVPYPVVAPPCPRCGQSARWSR